MAKTKIEKLLVDTFGNDVFKHKKYECSICHRKSNIDGVVDGVCTRCAANKFEKVKK